MLDLPKHRKHVADWYETVRTHAVTGEETTFTHATLYVEERAESELGFGLSDTLERQVVAKVPATALEAEGNDGFKASGYNRRNWTTTEPARKIVNTAFKAVGLQPFGPHSFPHMLSRHIARNCKSVAELVATSQNLGHTDVLTTFRNYGQINRDDQRKLVTGEDPDELIE